MNKYLKAISVNLFFLLINTISFLILTPIAIRIMGDEFYGLWVVLHSIMLFSNIGSLGIGSIVNKFAAEVDDIEPLVHNSNIVISAFIIILPMAIITSITLSLLSSHISANLNIDFILQQQFKKAILICSIGIIPQFIVKIPQGLLLSQYRNNVVRVMDFATNILPWVGAITISYFSKNMQLIAFWFALVQLITLIVYAFIIRKDISLKTKPSLQIVQRMGKFSFYTFIESTAYSLSQQIDRVIVSFTLGPAIAGVYSVGTSIGVRLSMIAGQITEVMIPYASLKNSKGENAILFEMFRKMSNYVSVIVTVLGSLLIIWMDELLTIWISPNYANQYSSAFRIIILAYVILSFCRSGHQTLQGMGKVRFTAFLYLFTSAIFLLGLYLFSVKFALLGASYANLIMAILLLINLKVYKLYKSKLPFFMMIYDLGLALAMLGIISSMIFIYSILFMKICLTILLIAFFSIFLSKDSFLQEQCRQLIKKNWQQKNY